jgi:hypothetical protein
MPKRALLTRIEQAAKPKGRVPPDCICFPSNEPPFFGFPIEQQIAAKVKCPLHGERFKPLLHLFVPAWMRENEKKRWSRLSDQYHKAWQASFPSDLWPVEEEEADDGRVFLKLRDGTRILAYEGVRNRSAS